MSSVTDFHFHFLIGQLQHRQFGPRGVLRSFESVYIFYSLNVQLRQGQFGPQGDEFRSLDSGLTQSCNSDSVNLDHVEMTSAFD